MPVPNFHYDQALLLFDYAKILDCDPYGCSSALPSSSGTQGADRGTSGKDGRGGGGEKEKGRKELFLPRPLRRLFRSSQFRARPTICP